MTDTLLADSARSGLFHLEAGQREALADQAVAAGLRLRTVDLNDCRTTKACLSTLGEVLGFPDWYGANLDALIDCLCDPDWLSPCGDVLLLSGLDRSRKTDRQHADALLSALATASAECRGTSQPLWILVDRPLPGVPPFPAT